MYFYPFYIHVYIKSNTLMVLALELQNTLSSLTICNSISLPIWLSSKCLYWHLKYSMIYPQGNFYTLCFKTFLFRKPEILYYSSDLAIILLNSLLLLYPPLHLKCFPLVKFITCTVGFNTEEGNHCSFLGFWET